MGTGDTNSTAEPPRATASGSREGEYTATVQFVAYENQLFWSIMGVFLVAETLLAGFLLGKPGTGHFVPIRFGAALLGAFGCLLWIAAALRSAAYGNLRTYQAKLLESEIGYSLLTRAEALAEGATVEVGGKAFRHSAFARIFTIKKSGIVLAALFLLFFLVIVGQDVVALCSPTPAWSNGALDPTGAASLELDASGAQRERQVA